MKKRQIVNIINFIRAVEPRCPVDLIEPVREQIALMKHHNLRGTFLLQYDAMLVPEIVAMLRELDPNQFELGVWHEIVQPEVESIGIPWTGRFPWDWHAHCGFSVGYTKEQRERLCDALFEKFREIFGAYPRVFGSWFFDSHTVRYLCDTYGLDALCNCKEQYGTDGYTLWGGYYGQGYYPSKFNSFCPAQTKENQVNVPILRMLGSDHVYQYDFGMSLEDGAKTQGVITLEPVYTGVTGGGGVPKWVDWYLRENYNGDCLSFGYAQAGQENAFGWTAMKDGLTYQFAEIARLQNEGKLEVEPMGDTGRWFKQTYEETPASAITAHNAFDDDKKTSIWYSNKYLRLNVYADGDAVRIRDLHVFAERYPDPFEETVCESNEAVYETLPLIDGNRHTGHGILAGGYFIDADGKELSCETMQFEDLGDGKLRLTYAPITVYADNNRIRIEGPKDFSLQLRRGSDDHMPTVDALSSNALSLSYNGTSYHLQMLAGTIASVDRLMSADGAIEIEINS